NFEFDSSFEFRHSSFFPPPQKANPGSARSAAWDRKNALRVAGSFRSEAVLMPASLRAKTLPHLPGLALSRLADRSGPVIHHPPAERRRNRRRVGSSSAIVTTLPTRCLIS